MNIPRSEHPNPQFERSNWLNLNGEWEFEIDKSKSGLERKLYEADKLNSKIIVPFCPESTLSGVGETDFLNAVWYKRTINIKDKNNRIILHIGACDYKTIVFVNGKKANVSVELAEIHLWEPGHGRLYDIELTFGDDVVKSYFGLRSVAIDGYKFLINGKSVFMRTVLDQGFYPDGIYTAPTDEALINDVKLSMDAGYNGARLHEKIFEPRFLYHCDRLGYLVWGEHANWGFDHTDSGKLHIFMDEWIESVTRDFNHPAIIGWCPFNETWDIDGVPQSDELIKAIYDITKQMDETRPCIDTSGSCHVATDMFDFHDYEQNADKFEEFLRPLCDEGIPVDQLARNPVYSHRHKYNGGPIFVSEYGGIKWDVENSNANSWGYGKGPKTEEEFIKRYKDLTHTIMKEPKICGFCYTQLYDVEQEQNGLYTYSRKPKFDMKIFKEINEVVAEIEK